MKGARVFGVIFVLIGIFGILFVLNSRIIGYAVVSVSEDMNQTGKLYFNSEGGNLKIEAMNYSKIFSTPGSSKNLSISIKNIGKALDNCSFLFEDSDWITASGEIKNLFSPAETLNIPFSLQIPVLITPGEYSTKLKLKCIQGELDLGDIQINVVDSFKLIKVKAIDYSDRKLDIEYIFDNSRLIGDKMSVDIIILDENSVEIYRHRDSFSINTNNVLDRKITLNASHDLDGIYYINFSPIVEPDNFVRESIIVGQPSATGFVTLNSSFERKAGYGVFIGILLVGIVFITWKQFFGEEEDKKKKPLMEENQENAEE